MNVFNITLSIYYKQVNAYEWIKKEYINIDSSYLSIKIDSVIKQINKASGERKTERAVHCAVDALNLSVENTCAFKEKK